MEAALETFEGFGDVTFTGEGLFAQLGDVPLLRVVGDMGGSDSRRHTRRERRLSAVGLTCASASTAGQACASWTSPRASRAGAYS